MKDSLVSFVLLCLLDVSISVTRPIIPSVREEAGAATGGTEKAKKRDKSKTKKPRKFEQKLVEVLPLNSTINFTTAVVDKHVFVVVAIHF